MSIGFLQIAIVVILVVLLFGRGKISGIMGDVAKGIKSFKKGMSSDVTDDKIPSDVTDDKIPSDVTDDSVPKNISEENKDSTNKE